MRGPLVLIYAAAIAALAGCYSDRGAATEPLDGDCRLSLGDDDLGTPHVVIAIRGFAFDPAEVRIRPGTRVTWVNCEPPATAPHTSTSDDGEWGSPLLRPGEQYSTTFGAAGSFPYHCGPHPFMKGVVIVEE